MLTALDRELALTTAWASDNLLEGGCSGIVWRSSSTAKARTKGARFVSRAVAAMRASSVSTGRAREASSCCGVSSVGPMRSPSLLVLLLEYLAFLLLGSSVWSAPERGRLPAVGVVVCARFRCALQAFCSERAALASWRADSTVLRGASAICWMLRWVVG